MGEIERKKIPPTFLRETGLLPTLYPEPLYPIDSPISKNLGEKKQKESPLLFPGEQGFPWPNIPTTYTH